ncbi:MAG: hypothetical protein HC800_24185 [Phormidesmis sp. RL_2_1]|nr:hypothetical protein [Phormidesmis sp. RL_2_1]
MENENTQVKQAARDGKGAYAGNVSPDPEIDVTSMGKQAGLDVQPEQPLSIAADMAERDQNRYELDADSKAEY